ncbi:MAG: hypothetical protein GX552_05405 [Chloroflexi bacterium]|nr:hypothetical protein [Chloroflexota bacterium]
MKPRLAYIICAVQRSGSSLLCEALKNTHLAGIPDEYFLCEEQGRWEDAGGHWARVHQVASRQQFLGKVFELGTTPNGVFGAKVMWNYFPYMLRNLRELPEYEGLTAPELMTAVFSRPQYVWIVRRNKVAQAVSWAKAALTGVYAWHKGQAPVRAQEPAFDFTFIDNLYKLVLQGEAGWAEFLQACGVEPFRVVYEDLVDAYEQTALDILDYLNISRPANMSLGERRLLRQADALNEQWAARYIQIKREMGDPVPRQHC